MRKAGLPQERHQHYHKKALRVHDSLDLLEDTGVLGHPHAQQFLASPVLVQYTVSALPQLLHVRPDKHLAEFDKVTMVLVVDFDDTPRVHASADRPTVGCLYLLVGADDGKGDLALRMGR